MRTTAPRALTSAFVLLCLVRCTDEGGTLGDGGLDGPDVPRLDTGPDLPDAGPWDLGPNPDSGPWDLGPNPDSGPYPDSGPGPDSGPPPELCSDGPVEACTCGDRPGTRRCRDDGTVGCCRCEDPSELERLVCYEAGVVGTWAGTVTTPWRPPYRVQVILRADGSYGAWCLDGAEPGCTAFYYGVDGDRQGRTYRLEDVRPRDATGTIDVVFRPNDGRPGELTAVTLSEDENRLSFDVFNTWSGGRYGPIHFELERQP